MCGRKYAPGTNIISISTAQPGYHVLSILNDGTETRLPVMAWGLIEDSWEEDNGDEVFYRTVEPFILTNDGGPAGLQSACGVGNVYGIESPDASEAEMEALAVARLQMANDLDSKPRATA